MYAAVAMATDYDCWRECEDNVHAADVLVVFRQNVDKITNVLLETVKIIGCGDWEQDILKLKVIFVIWVSIVYLYYTYNIGDIFSKYILANNDKRKINFRS